MTTVKAIPAGFLAVFLMIASCKKDEGQAAGPGSWSLNGSGYPVTSASFSGNVLNVAASSPVGALNITFPSVPVAAGTYRVVSGIPGNNEVNVLVTTATTAYRSTGNDLLDATVSVGVGKVSITIPSVWVKNASGGMDSLQFSGNITEQ